VERHRLSGQELAHDSEAFVHPPAPASRVHSAGRDLMAILTADPGPEDEPARGDPGDVGELARHQHRMAQQMWSMPAAATRARKARAASGSCSSRPRGGNMPTRVGVTARPAASAPGQRAGFEVSDMP
jgi:hypothetical protein